jgi:tRNA(adenine34) deaminase
MNVALTLARESRTEDVPVGAVVVVGGEIVGKGVNQGRIRHDPTGHAEIVALRMAAEALQNYRLPKSVLYVTLEPCFMCFGALLESRVSRLVFGAREPRRGVTGSLYDLHNDPRLTHRVEVVEGACAEESAALLREFFEKKRGRENGSGMRSVPSSPGRSFPQ